MNLYWRTTVVFFSILILGWLSLQLSLYQYMGMGGILLPGLLFGATFAVVNFEGRQKKIRGLILTSVFATVSILAAFLLLFAAGPEGAGAAGRQYGFLLGFSCAAPLTILIFAAYGLSWPSAVLAVALGSILPAVLGFEDAQDGKVKPELFGYLWLAAMGAVYTWGLKEEIANKT